MYYRKYFEGNTEGTLTDIITKTFGSYTYNVFINQSKILGNAVASVLCDAGMDAYYDTDNFLLYPNREEGFCIGLFSNAAAQHVIISLNSSNTSSSSQGTSAGPSYQPFDTNGDAYKFYVTIIGEPQGMLRVYIGNMNNPATMTWGFMIGYGQDKRNNRRVAYLAIGAVAYTTVTFMVRYADDNSLPDGVSYSSTTSFSVAAVTGQTNKLVLINAFSKEGYFTLDNCYLGCSALSYGQNSFYLINGTEYYYPCSTLLIKCPSKINS